MISSPLVSVIVPCYNQAQYLDECLQSVLDQTFENWECIIINDGSPDHTEEVAERWTKKDPRFKYFFKENGGVSSARNYGIERAEGEWILPLDGDDYLKSDYLAVGLKHFGNKNLKLIYGNVQGFGLQNIFHDAVHFNLKYLASFNFINCSAFYRKSDWKKIGGYDEKMIYGLEDWEFWINLLKDDSKALKEKNMVLYFREKISSRNVNINKLQLKEMKKYIETKHYKFVSEQLGTIMDLYEENLSLKGIFNGKRQKFISSIVNFSFKYIK